MTRRIASPKINSRTARAKLKPSPQPIYADLGAGLHVGYRKGQNKGAWVVRYGKPYKVETFAEADDVSPSNKTSILTFDEAVERARGRAQLLAAKASGAGTTVAEAVETYVNARLTRDAQSSVRSKMKHVLEDEIAAVQLAALSADDLVAWRDRLRVAPTSKRRVANDFRASLNTVARRFRKVLPTGFETTIRDGFRFASGGAAVARDKQILSDADIRALIEAAWQIDAKESWGNELARLIVAMAATGSRFSQLVRCRVVDLQIAEQRLMVPVSKKGGGPRQITHTPIQLGADVIDALTPATFGRPGSDMLFLRPKWRRIPGGPGFGRLEVYGKFPWSASSEFSKVWRRVVKQAKLSPAIVSYSLRHSSVVRGLRAGLPVQLVAKLHDTSSQMLKSHYAAHIVSGLDEMVRRAIVPLTSAPPAPLRAVK